MWTKFCHCRMPFQSLQKQNRAFCSYSHISLYICLVIFYLKCAAYKSTYLLTVKVASVVPCHTTVLLIGFSQFQWISVSWLAFSLYNTGHKHEDIQAYSVLLYARCLVHHPSKIYALLYFAQITDWLVTGLIVENFYGWNFLIVKFH